MTGNRARLMKMRRALPGLAASNGASLARLSAWLRAGFVAGLLAASLLVFCLPPAFAKSATSGLGGGSASANSKAAEQQRQQLGKMLQQPKIDSTEPMLLQADEMVYDNENSKITAKGDVEAFALLQALGLPFATQGRPAGFDQDAGDENSENGSKD